MSTPPSSAPVPLTAAQETFLRAFARAALLVPKLLDDDLLRGGRLSISEYFVLVHLSEAPQRRLRMSDLAGAAAMSVSGMTRVVQRLEVSGLVLRERSVDDGRGWFAVLTNPGFERLEQAWPAHLDSVRQRVFAHLGDVDLSTITAALKSMTRCTGGPCAATDEDPANRSEVG